MIFGKQSLNMKRVSWFMRKFRPKNVSFEEEMNDIWPKMHIGLHVNTRYSRQISMKTEFSELIFE